MFLCLQGAQKSDTIIFVKCRGTLYAPRPWPFGRKESVVALAKTRARFRTLRAPTFWTTHWDSSSFFAYYRPPRSRTPGEPMTTKTDPSPQSKSPIRQRQVTEVMISGSFFSVLRFYHTSLLLWPPLWYPTIIAVVLLQPRTRKGAEAFFYYHATRKPVRKLLYLND